MDDNFRIFGINSNLIVKPNADRDLILNKAKRSIHEKFGIKHATIQLEGKNICLSEDSCN